MLLPRNPDDEVPGVPNANYKQQYQRRSDRVPGKRNVQYEPNARKQEQDVRRYRKTDEPSPVKNRKLVVAPLSVDLRQCEVDQHAQRAQGKQTARHKHG